MAYTFFMAQGLSIGDSIHEKEQLETAKEFLKEAAAKKIPIWLPKDIVVASDFRDDAPSEVIEVEKGIPKGWQGMDTGPKTVHEWEAQLKKAATIFWNGPLGVFEFPHFAKGTNQIALLLAGLKATTIVGGGDSVAAINNLGVAKKFSHVSTGGGASLEYLELGHLPGIDALTDA